jgi:hypothetical protein
VRKAGPERVRKAIAQDRGLYAPDQPLTLCDQRCGLEWVEKNWWLLNAKGWTRDQQHDALRADFVPPPKPLPLWRRVANRLVAPIAKVMGF